MVSPVPKHLTTDDDHAAIFPRWLNHVVDLRVDPSNGVKTPGAGSHRAKYAPGLATALLNLAGTDSVGDPMAGTGTIARETGIAAALNDLDAGMAKFLDPLRAAGPARMTTPSAGRWSGSATAIQPIIPPSSVTRAASTPSPPTGRRCSGSTRTCSRSVAG